MHSRRTRKPADRLNRTYILPAGLVDRLDQVAESYRVGQSDLVHFLLDYALGRVECGELTIPTRPQGLLTIDHERRDR